MGFAKRVLMFLGLVVLVAAVVSVLAPKATHALVATLVQVANTSANPAIIRDTDNSGRGNIQNPNCQAFSTPGLAAAVFCSPSYTVPAGQRLVIEQLEANCSTPEGNNLNQPVVDLTVGGNENFHVFALTSQGNFQGLTRFVQNQQVRYYADPGTALNFSVDTSDQSGLTQCNFEVNGYLISYP